MKKIKEEIKDGKVIKKDDYMFFFPHEGDVSAKFKTTTFQTSISFDVELEIIEELEPAKRAVTTGKGKKAKTTLVEQPRAPAKYRTTARLPFDNNGVAGTVDVIGHGSSLEEAFTDVKEVIGRTVYVSRS